MSGTRWTDEQSRVIKTRDCNLLVSAAAGSGKTAVLVERIISMVLGQYGKEPVDIDKLLVVTFTRAAAGEMRERVDNLVGFGAESIWVSTFHSMCVRILRRDIDLIGYDLNFGILDDADQLSVIKTAMEDLNLDPKRQSPKYFLSQISNAKNELKTPRDLVKEFENEDVIRVYEKYQQTLFKNNRLDFDDLLMLTVHLFEKHPEVLSFYQNKFQYIHIDEYQDTNHAQYKIVTLLAQKFRNICVVGDSDQSIYSWRGANIENILSFENDYPDANVVLLEQNYRSKQTILNAANDVIKNNSGRLDKKLWSDRGEGEAIEYYRAQEGDIEANYIADKIAYMRRDTYDYHDFAVLYRTNSQSRAIEQALLRQNIPYRLVGGQSYFKRKEIKDLMAYLRLICNPDDDLSFVRVVNEPKRGIGEATVTKIEQISSDLGENPLEIMYKSDSLAPIVARSKQLKSLAEMFYELAELVDVIPLEELLDEVMDRSGYELYLKSQGDEGITRLENIAELKSTMANYEENSEEPTLAGFLEEISLYTDIDNFDEDGDYVVMMTMHSAKGLEFPKVFVVGMEENIFPSSRSCESEEEIEEERRLAYVAITRAKEKLYLTHARQRMLYGRTDSNRVSRFIKELPVENIEKTEEPGMEDFFPASDKQVNAPYSINLQQQLAQRNRTSDQMQSQEFSVGDRVKHNIFGEGLVLSATKMANDTLLEIAFETKGTKKIMANFAKLKKL